MAIKIEGNRVIVTTDTSANHRVTKKDTSIKSKQMGECSICGEVLLYYLHTKSSEWWVCSIASRKNSYKNRRKKREDLIKENDKYLSVPYDTITNINERI